MSATKERRDAALEYASWGWNVFPLNGKRPFPGTHGHNDATTNKKQIRVWWKEYPTANIGIRCDSTTGPIVLDVDGPDGEDLFREMETKYGRVETLEATSGRKHRRHLYFSPDGKKINRTIKVQKRALDILGDGGYVVAPPSIHPETGKPYRWLNDLDPLPVPPFVRRLTTNGKSKRAAAPLPKTLGEGERDTLLTSLAGSMRRRGASPDAILAALMKENETRCDPPLAQGQLEKIAKSIGAKDPIPIDFSEPINDINMARRFAELEAGSICYCARWRRWLVWDGKRWAIDREHEVDRRIEAMVRGAFDLLESVDDATDRGKIFNQLNAYTRRRKLEDIREQAKIREAFMVTPDQLDADPWLLNVENGTLDLQTAKLRRDRTVSIELRAHDPEDLITKLAPVTYYPKVDSPLWNGFLTVALRKNADIEWSDPLGTIEADPELENYLRRLAGITLTGDVRHDVFPFIYGPGRSGKTTFAEAFQRLLGDYAVTIGHDLLLKRDIGDHRDLPRLHRARLALVNELPEGARWNEATVKRLTGGDTQDARLLYQEKFQFDPTAKIWSRANAKPAAYDPSKAFWERMRLFPFDYTIPKDRRDESLRKRLQEDVQLSGILNWALAGCADWLADGKKLGKIPERVRMATEEYEQEEVENDPIAAFFEERCELHPGSRKTWTPSAALYKAMEQWWRERGRPHRDLPTMKAFTSALSGRGLTNRKKMRGGKQMKGWLGIKLLDVFG